MFAVSSNANDRAFAHSRDSSANSADRYYPMSGDLRHPATPGGPTHRALTPTGDPSQSLLDGAAPLGGISRQPTVPAVERHYHGTYAPSYSYGGPHHGNMV